MNYSDWEKTVPECIKADSVWTKPIYRCALFLSDLCWQDAGKLVKDQRTREFAGQLYDTVGAIGADLVQGFSFTDQHERARFLAASVGSSRASRHWYYKARHVLGTKLSQHRLNLLTIIIRLTLSLMPESSRDWLREESVPYGANLESENSENLIPRELLENVPVSAVDGENGE